MKIQATILCENHVGVPFGVIGEHGFACFIETEKGNYLFDTGQGFGILQNAAILKKDLSSIRSIMISHGHYDHTGGLPAVLKQKGPVDVYAHPDIFIDRYWADDTTRRYIGMPFKKSFLEGIGARFRLGVDMAEVGEGIYWTGEIPRKTPFEKGDANMIACPPEEEPIQPDPIKDDASLIIDSDSGLIVILGCAHAGMINILNYAIEQLRKDRIYAVIGGTHLGFSSPEQFEETLKVIDDYKIEHLGVSHCTGPARAAELAVRLKKRFFFGSVGATLTG